MANVGAPQVRYAWTVYAAFYTRVTQRAKRYEIKPTSFEIDVSEVPLFDWFKNGHPSTFVSAGEVEVDADVIARWADHIDITNLPQMFFNVVMERMFPLPFPHNFAYSADDHVLQPTDEEFSHRSPLPRQSFYTIDDLHAVLKLQDVSDDICFKVRRWIDSHPHVKNGWMGALEKENIFHCYEDAHASISYPGGIIVSPRPDVICQMAAENTEDIHFCIKYCHLSPAAYDRMGRSLLHAAIHANNEDTMLMLIDMIPGRILNKPMEVATVPVMQPSPTGSQGSHYVEEVTTIEAEWLPLNDDEHWAWHPLHWLVKLRNPRVLDAMIRKYVEDQVAFPEWFQEHHYRLRMCQFVYPSTAEELHRNGYDISSTFYVIPRIEIPAPSRHLMSMSGLENLWDDYNDPQDIRRNPGLGYPVYIESYSTSSWHEATKHPFADEFMAWMATRSERTPYITNSKNHTPLHHAALGNDVSCLHWLCQNMDILHTVSVGQPDGRPDKVFNSIILAAFSRAWNSVKVFDTIMSYSPEDYENDLDAAKSVFLAIIYGMDKWLSEEPPEWVGFQIGPIPQTGLRLPTPRQIASQKCQAFVSRLPARWNGSWEQLQVIEEAKLFGFDFLQHSLRTPRAATRSMTRMEEEAELLAEREAELEVEWLAQSNHPEMGDLVKVAKMAKERGAPIHTPQMRKILEEQAARQARERARTKREMQEREEAWSWGGTWSRVMEALQNAIN